MRFSPSSKDYWWEKSGADTGIEWDKDVKSEEVCVYAILDILLSSSCKISIFHWPKYFMSSFYIKHYREILYEAMLLYQDESTL